MFGENQINYSAAYKWTSDIIISRELQRQISNILWNRFNKLFVLIISKFLFSILFRNKWNVQKLGFLIHTWLFCLIFWQRIVLSLSLSVQRTWTLFNLTNLPTKCAPNHCNHSIQLSVESTVKQTFIYFSTFNWKTDKFSTLWTFFWFWFLTFFVSNFTIKFSSIFFAFLSLSLFFCLSVFSLSLFLSNNRNSWEIFASHFVMYPQLENWRLLFWKLKILKKWTLVDCLVTQFRIQNLLIFILFSN